jgi:hypothetical protein
LQIGWKFTINKEGIHAQKGKVWNRCPFPAISKINVMRPSRTLTSTLIIFFKKNSDFKTKKVNFSLDPSDREAFDKFISSSLDSFSITYERKEKLGEFTYTFD